MPDSSTRLALVSAIAGAILLAIAAIVATATTAIAATSETKIRFIEPENFTDARLNRPAGGADAIVLVTLERHLQQLGNRCLPPGQSLELSIHDIDLAGQVEWWHGPARQTRVLRDVTWPRIKLSYAVQESGQSAGYVPQDLSDLDYLSQNPRLRTESMALPYERAMLNRWFEQQFCNK